MVSRNLKTNGTARRQNWKLQSNETAQSFVYAHVVFRILAGSHLSLE